MGPGGGGGGRVHVYMPPLILVLSPCLAPPLPLLHHSLLPRPNPYTPQLTPHMSVVVIALNGGQQITEKLLQALETGAG